ncbi:MAG: TauD/TfdA family dioxygenase [Rhodospirillaceae bacterium]|nr:TauD/TfdA family dioxygenase [Rhodospirillaceae bacterium]
MAQTADPFSSITVTPMAVHIGAEIGGVDLTRPLPSEQVADIRAALLRWKVIFFRDQMLDHDQHVAFARQFGDPTPAHVVYGGQNQQPEIYSIAKFRKANSNRGQGAMRPWSGWHTDITAAINPPAASILRGVTVPPYGGDTQFTNLAVAYNTLSPTLRGLLDHLRAVHRFAVSQGATAVNDHDKAVQQHTLVSEHPMVTVHPETGERVLYANPAFVEGICGMEADEGRWLMELLWEHIIRPDFTVRFRWQPGSIAFWDNRATAHLAPRDIFDTDFERQFYRVTLNGEVPVGIDGRPSTAIEGRPIEPVARP